MPVYRFLSRRPGTLVGEVIEAEFPNDEAAIADARTALADAVRDDVLEHKRNVEEIEVTDEHGTVVATITLLDPQEPLD